MKTILCTLFTLTLFLVSGQTATKLSVLDTRSVNDAPSAYDKEAVFEFKNRNTVGAPGTGLYSGLLTVAPWSDNSGNRHHQLNFNDGGLFYRSGLADESGWNQWKSIVTADPEGDLNIAGKLSTSGKITHLWGAHGDEHQSLMFAGWERAHAGIFWRGSKRTFTLATANDASTMGQYGDVNLAVDGTINSKGTITTQSKIAYLWGAHGDEYQALMFAGWQRAHGGIFWKGADRTFTIATGNNQDEMGTYGAAHLAVSGTVTSREVQVTIDAGTGPDYVFEPDYDLPSLEETEAYIQSEKHLPEIPSAAEMEANGILLGELNILLLKKIEELTLYTIEQEKKLKKQELLEHNIQQLKMENRELKEGYSALLTRIGKLESNQ